MSGPKVVRIVTREEVISICRQHLARLDSALERWERQLTKRDLVSSQDISEMRARRDRIVALLEEDRLSDLQKAAVAEIGFLEEDAEERVVREAKRSARLKTSARRMAATANALIKQLESFEGTIPAGLINIIGSIAAGAIQDIGAANASLNEAFSVLASSTENPTRTLTEKQQELAAVLGESVPTQTFDEWLRGAPNRKTSVNERIDGYIARLEQEHDEGAARPYIDRLTRISAEADASRQRMLADTLVLDLAEEIARRKENRRLEGMLEALDAELATFEGGTVAKARGAIAQALAAENRERAERTLGFGQDVLKTEQAALAAAARRAAILTGLSQLGYEVREGMETALAKGAQVVIQKARNPDYGLEVLTPPGGKVQVRVVSFERTSVAHDTKDRDMETIWCSELSELERMIADEAGEVAIERAVEAGAMPVKIVSRTAVDTGRPRVVVDKLHAREAKLS